ncbi:FAD dependent oxidoreductase monooxygenase [Fusarium tjaetaba]|uniref:FAD dependent oxidoreductase monooxygenase n=1 Tax=Fusarium tjaetaba TaxID=1567544 RepID=A0A8H5QH06_9HYPO|nr:FAD dependent oxidoreductase monooxygenase [Fusarium tjaetaba]KAF5613641.1 FAD dependent oxidoreductase monooxygenase [Fusarium tjaetaba]
MASFNVIIIGAGLSGALLANGLFNNGVQVAIYERDDKETNREGYHIYLGSPALAGFKACLNSQQLDAVLGKLGRNSSKTMFTAPTVHDAQFRKIIELVKVPFYAKSTPINRSTLRRLLHEPLQKAGCAFYGHIFQSYEHFVDEYGCDKIRVQFTDGTTATCDVLIGADGSASRVNYQVGARNLVPLPTKISFLDKGRLPYSKLRELPEVLQKGPVFAFSKGIVLLFAVYLPPKSTSVSKDVIDKNQPVYEEEEASWYWSLTVDRDMIPFIQLSDIPQRRIFCQSLVKTWSPE